jgi:hypothetical protein
MAILTEERNKAESRDNVRVHNYMLQFVYGDICFFDGFSKAAW